MPTIRIEGNSAEIVKALDRMADRIKPTLNGAIRKEVPGMVAAAEAAARSLNIVNVGPKGSKGARRKRTMAASGGLRDQIARAVSVRFDSERVVVFADRDKMPSGKEGLPMLTAQRSWRHPVFGNSNVWVEQRARAGWLSRAVRAHANRTVPAEIQKAMGRLIT
jgi:hypothetical protein